MTETNSLLSVLKLSKSFGRKEILREVSFQVNAGEIVCLVGPNGSGKTTILKSIAGIYRSDLGSIMYSGKPSREIDKEQIGYLPEERGLFQKESVISQAKYFSALKGMSKNEFEESFSFLAHALDLEEKANQKVGELSLGNQQRVQWLITLIHKPRILLLDEPFNGLDPHSLKIIKQLLFQLKAEGVGILFSSHQLLYIEEIAERILLIKSGQIENEILGEDQIDLTLEYEKTYHG
ncbi:MAG: hypothetical protein RL130_909 [Actinomycetota bacterium]|jgi:ABC-2 type transport system ATP-binding protein